MTENTGREEAEGFLRGSRGQVLRYLVVGSFNTAVSFSIYSLLVWLGAAIPLASLGSIVLGICVSFVTLGKLVFISHLRGRFHRFVIAWVFLYGFNVGTIAVIMTFGTGPYVAGLLAGLITAAISFLVQRRYVFG